MKKCGFTIIELLVVIVVIGILAMLLTSLLGKGSREKAFYTRTNSEMNSMSNALTLYVDKYNDYPAEASRDIPAGIKEFLSFTAACEVPGRTE